jgi:hypothetical protein
MRNLLRPHRVTSARPSVVSVHGPLVEPRPLVDLLGSAYARAGTALRVHVLERLIGCVGSLALAAIAHGAFAKHLTQHRGGRIVVSLEDAETTRAEDVEELARYVEQSDPQCFASILGELAALIQGQPPTCAAT